MDVSRTRQLIELVGRVALLASLPALLLACGQPRGEELLGGKFVSTQVEQEGEPRQLIEGPVEVEFEERDGEGDAVRWSAGCNIIGGRFEITENRLRPVVGPGQDPGFESTAVGCAQEQHEQDDRLTEVFAQGPEWQLDGETLELSTEHVTIRFRER